MATSWDRNPERANNRLYNAGNERNATTGWDETYFRMYDPAIGRFHDVDPLAVKYAGMTPYNYVGGNPIAFNDPLGDDYLNDNLEWVEYDDACGCMSIQTGGGSSNGRAWKQTSLHNGGRGSYGGISNGPTYEDWLNMQMLPLTSENANANGVNFNAALNGLGWLLNDVVDIYGQFGESNQTHLLLGILDNEDNYTSIAQFALQSRKQASGGIEGVEKLGDQLSEMATNAWEEVTKPQWNLRGQANPDVKDQKRVKVNGNYIYTINNGRDNWAGAGQYGQLGTTPFGQGVRGANSDMTHEVNLLMTDSWVVTIGGFATFGTVPAAAAINAATWGWGAYRLGFIDSIEFE